ncbi:hypothetical protein [Streptomyces sp. NPDC050121]|uniref:hypothetical protein n=1 Tax=Streptomyces sp. NPDC050121 TaxID=3365601 RepID=UPI00379AD0F3
MYRIAIVRKGQPADRRTCTTLGELQEVVREVIRADGGTITDADDTALAWMARDAYTMAADEGFAAIELGAASITIRPGPAPTPTFPGGGF